MPSGRDKMLYHLDRAKASLDQTLYQLRIPYEKYKERDLEQAVLMEGLIAGVIKLQEAIQAFRENWA